MPALAAHGARRPAWAPWRILRLTAADGGHRRRGRDGPLSCCAGPVAGVPASPGWLHLTLDAYGAAARVLAALARRRPAWKGIAARCPVALLWLLNVHAAAHAPRSAAVHERLPAAAAVDVVDTEREALEAGTVWWDGELFTGDPDWNKLQASAPARRPPRSRRSSTAPASSCARCSTTGTSRTGAATCRPRSGTSCKTPGFFAMIIPKRYGGLEFSAYAHSCVLVKLAEPQRHGCLDRRRAELARARRTAQCTTAPKSRRTTTCRAWRAARSALLRADRSARRLRRRLDPRHRRRLPRPRGRAARSSACA